MQKKLMSVKEFYEDTREALSLERLSSAVEGALPIKSSGHRIETLGDNISVCGLLFAAGRDEEEVRARLIEARAAIQVIVG